MPDQNWLEEQACLSLQRLLPRVKKRCVRQAQERATWQAFVRRLEVHFGALFQPLYHLYGQRYDFFYHLENVLDTAARMWLARPQALKELDAAREPDPLWFQSSEMVAGVCYVDLFAANLRGVREKIPYFYDHRQFLNEFYTGRYPRSFARGLHFQEDPRTGEARVAGTCASLAGLEKAIHEETEREVELAIRRVLLLHAVVLSAGGIPLIYLGDEVGFLNNYAYRDSPAYARDSRWVNRPVYDWGYAAQRNDPDALPGRIYRQLQRLICIRKEQAAFSGGALEVMDTGCVHVLGYVRTHHAGRIVVLANFTEREQVVAANQVRLYGLGYSFTDLASEAVISLRQDVVLEPYQFLWLTVSRF